MYLVPGSERILLVTEGIGPGEEKKRGEESQAFILSASRPLSSVPLPPERGVKFQGLQLGGGVSGQDELTAPDGEKPREGGGGGGDGSMQRLPCGVPSPRVPGWLSGLEVESIKREGKPGCCSPTSSSRRLFFFFPSFSLSQLRPDWQFVRWVKRIYAGATLGAEEFHSLKFQLEGNCGIPRRRASLVPCGKKKKRK